MTATSSVDTAVAAQANPAAARPKRRGKREGHIAAYGMVAPAALLLLLFLVIPVLLAFGLSFTNARLISPNAPRFVGLDNFVRAFVAERPELRRPFYQVPHRHGVTGTAANFVLHVSDLMDHRRRPFAMRWPVLRPHAEARTGLSDGNQATEAR